MFFRNLTLLGGRVLRSRLVKNRQPTRAKQNKKSAKASCRTASPRKQTRGKWVPHTPEEKKFSELIQKTQKERDRAIKVALRDALAKEVRTGKKMRKQQNFYMKNRIAASKELSRIQKELKRMPRPKLRIVFPVVQNVRKKRVMERAQRGVSAQEAERIFFNDIKEREAQRKQLIVAKIKEMKQQQKVGSTPSVSESEQTTTTTTTRTRSRKSTKALSRTAGLTAAASLKEKDSGLSQASAEEAFYAELTRLEAQRREEIAQLIEASTTSASETKPLPAITAEATLEGALTSEQEDPTLVPQALEKGARTRAQLSASPSVPKRRKPRVLKMVAAPPPSVAEESMPPPIEPAVSQATVEEVDASLHITPARKIIRAQATQRKPAVQLSFSTPRITTVTRFSKQDAPALGTAPLLRKPVGNADMKPKTVFVTTAAGRPTGLLRF